MIAILERAVIECGSLVLKTAKSTDIRAENKEEQLGQHFSTRADRESLALGLSIIRQVYPDEIIVAEEQENAGIPPDCTVFDPLDGTTNFFNGILDCGITACTLRNGRPVASATYFLSDGMLVSAVRGEGCLASRSGIRKKLEVISWHGQIDKTQIGTDIGSWTHRSGTFDSILRPLSEHFNILSSMSAIEGGRRVLFGQLGAYYNIGIAKIWDAAAMSLAIEEVGGMVCAPDGSPLKWDAIRTDWIMSINQQLLDIVLEHSRAWCKR